MSIVRARAIDLLGLLSSNRSAVLQVGTHRLREAATMIFRNSLPTVRSARSKTATQLSHYPVVAWVWVRRSARRRAAVAAQ